MQSVYMDFEAMEYLVWVLEIASKAFFNGDKTITYNTLKEQGILDFYSETYDVTHSLSSQYILDELSDMLKAKGVI